MLYFKLVIVNTRYQLFSVFFSQNRLFHDIHLRSKTLWNIMLQICEWLSTHAIIFCSLFFSQNGLFQDFLPQKWNSLTEIGGCFKYEELQRRVVSVSLSNGPRSVSVYYIFCQPKVWLTNQDIYLLKRSNEPVIVMDDLHSKLVAWVVP